VERAGTAKAVTSLVIASMMWLVGPVAMFFLFFGDPVDRKHDPRDAQVPYFFAGILVVGAIAMALAILSRRRHPAVSITALCLASPWVALGALACFAMLRRAVG
jgi:hypothetical protein